MTGKSNSLIEVGAKFTKAWRSVFCNGNVDAAPQPVESVEVVAPLDFVAVAESEMGGDPLSMLGEDFGGQGTGFGGLNGPDCAEFFQHGNPFTQPRTTPEAVAAGRLLDEAFKTRPASSALTPEQ